MKFLGREEELKKLHHLWNLRQSSLVAITGRRRIGKSRLAQEFGKTADHFLEIQGLAPHPKITAQDQINNFLKIACTWSRTPQITAQDWYGAFFHLSNILPKKGRVILFLDEISWMAKDDPSFPSTLKLAWDTLFSKHPKVILILCGSVSSWIEENILNSTSFVGRVQVSLYLEEMPLPLLPQFISSNAAQVSVFDMIKLFSITGGIPTYLEAFDPKYSVDDNIDRLAFKKGGLFVREFENIFSDIFDKRAKIYRDIVSQLVTGRKTYEQVCKGLKLQRSGTILKYLEDLKHSGFVARDYNYLQEKRSKPSYFRLKDNYLRFYLRYIEPQLDKIQKGLFETGKRTTLPEWSIISGLQFENLVLNNIPFILEKLTLLPSEILSVSPYYQSKTKKNKGSCQIDLLIQTKANIFYICEMKYRKKIGADVITELQKKVKIFKRPKYSSVLTVLICCGEIDPQIEESEQISRFIRMEDVFKGNK